MRWVVRDPMNLRFFYMSEAEYQVLQSLHLASNQIDLVDRASAISGLPPMAVFSFLQSTIRAGLIRAEHCRYPSHASQFVGTQNQFQRLVGLSLSPLRMLSIRIPLFDPTPLLANIDWVGRLLFSRIAAIALFCIWAVVVMLAAFNWDRIQMDIVDIRQWFGWSGIVGFAIAYFLLKSFHEAGHAIACQRFGAQCREAGLFLICLMPCFYCDVSDAWKIDSRFRRAAIGAAGIYCELWIAGLAGIVWMFTLPSIIHSLAFSLFIIGSIGTILLNANPLLRFDGYYVLTDISDIPNLSSQSQRAWRDAIRRCLSNTPLKSNNFDGPVAILLCFGIFSWLYRAMAILLIAWSLDFVMGQLRLSTLGRVLAVALIGAFALQTLFSLRTQIMRMWKHPDVSRWGLIGLSMLSCIAAYWLATVPFSLDSHAIGLLSSRRSTPVYVSHDGQLLEIARSGTEVQPGHQLFRLESVDQRLVVAELETEFEELSIRLKNWVNDFDSATEGAAAKATLVETLESLQKRLDSARAELSELSATSPSRGRFIIAPRSEQKPAADGLIAKNVSVRRRRASTRNAIEIGNQLRRGELVGWVFDDESLIVEAFIDERQIRNLEAGDRVRMRLDADPSVTLHGKIEAIRSEPLDKLPTFAAESMAEANQKAYRIIVMIESQLPESWLQIEDLTVHLSMQSRPKSLLDRLQQFLVETIRW